MDDTSAKIYMFVKRMFDGTGRWSPKKALWMLPGGPGGDSRKLEHEMHKLHQVVGEEYGIYTTDHRGAGRSHRFSCLHSQAETIGSDGGVYITQNEYKECINDVEPHYTSVDGALDMLSLMHRLEQSGIKQQYLYGLSYGTYWATRIMQLPDAQKYIFGIFLDGVCSTYGHAGTFTTVDQIDEKTNQVGFKLLEKNCAQDALCARKLGNNPKLFGLELLEKMQKGHCLDKLQKSHEGLHTIGVPVTMNNIKAILSEFLFTTREYIPVLLYRLDRCSLTEDVEALQYFFKKSLRMDQDNCTSMFSPMLYNHITLSEMYSVIEPTQFQLETVYNTSLFATGETLESYTLKQYWPVYKPDPMFYNKTFTTASPVVLVNGDLDSSTALEFAQQQYESIVQTTGHKQLIVMPNSPHNTLANSHTLDSDKTCTMQLLIAFLKDTEAKLTDHPCLQQLTPIDFSGDAKYARRMFSVEVTGGDDIFEASYSEVKTTPMVSLYLLLGIVTSTAVTAFVTIVLLIMYVIETKNKAKRVYEGM